jgi:MFS family permease
MNVETSRAGPGSVLRNRDFRLFWIGAFVSNTGTWLQNAAVPYVLYKLTGSNVWVGLSVFAALIPGVVCGPIGGAVADRVDRRKMLFAVQFAAAVTAVTLAGLWVGHYRSPATILALTAVGGVFMGIGMPAWQGFVADLVPRSELNAAVTLNSVQFHGSRAVGPILAGAMLATVGPAWAFAGNALSFLAVLVAIWLVRTKPRVAPKSGSGIVSELRAGLSYVLGHRGIATALLLVMTVGFLGNPIVQLAPEFSDRIYHVGPRAYGFLTGAFGLGAASGVYLVGWLTQRRSRSWVLVRALFVLGAAVIGFGLSPTYPLGVVCVLVAGSSAVGAGVVLLTAVQDHVEDAFRGRVLGVYGMAFTASYPFGALAQGALSQAIGARANELAVGSVIIAVALVLLSKRDRLLTINAVG